MCEDSVKVESDKMLTLRQKHVDNDDTLCQQVMLKQRSGSFCDQAGNFASSEILVLLGQNGCGKDRPVMPYGAPMQLFELFPSCRPPSSECWRGC